MQHCANYICLLTTKSASDRRFEDEVRVLVDTGTVLALVAALVAASIVVGVQVLNFDRFHWLLGM